MFNHGVRLIRFKDDGSPLWYPSQEFAGEIPELMSDAGLVTVHD